MSDYANVLLWSISVPFILSFFPPLKIWSNKRALLLSIALIILTFGAWDVFAIFRGHWKFNPEGVWDFRIINLPVEEVLFFVVIPFCCIFTWEVVKYLKSRLK